MNSSAARSSPSVQFDTVTVDLGERSYPILIGVGALREIGGQLAGRTRNRQAALITNPTVGRLYGDAVREALAAAGFNTVVIEIPDGEEHKNLESLALVYERLSSGRMERGSPIVALGGGVVGDVAGFAAATFLRGVPYVQVPTTLLAQVDSSVGGKTGINIEAGKNLVGAFYQPSLVLIEPETLRTLPRREFGAGLAEVVKYGAILDSELFALLERQLDQILALDMPLLRSVVRRCCELKAMVVRRDERESDFRSILNFGHTLGHGLESVTEYKRFLHGEAIAIGMAFAAELSAVRGYCTKETMQRIINLLKRCGLPVAIPAELISPNLALAMGSDKKVSGAKIKFVCLEELGRTRFEHLTASDVFHCATRAAVASE